MNKNYYEELVDCLMINVVIDKVSEDLKEYRQFVFTTAKGLHFYTDQEMYKSRVKCFGYQELRQLVDNNYLFWNNLKELIK